MKNQVRMNFTFHEKSQVEMNFTLHEKSSKDELYLS
jgi:hypothetical protein